MPHFSPGSGSSQPADVVQPCLHHHARFSTLIHAAFYAAVCMPVPYYNVWTPET